MDERPKSRFEVTYFLPITAHTLVSATDEDDARRIVLARWRDRCGQPDWQMEDFPLEPAEVEVWPVSQQSLELVHADDAGLDVEALNLARRLREVLREPLLPGATLFHAALTWTESTKGSVDAVDVDEAHEEASEWWEELEGPAHIQDRGPWRFVFELGLLDSWTEVEGEDELAG